MQVVISILAAVFCWAEVLVVDVPVPEFDVVDNKIFVKDAAYLDVPGAPKLPCTKVTIALPPGAFCESVEFSGTREKFGDCTAQPAEPLLPLMQDEKMIAKSFQTYEHLRRKIYSHDHLYPETSGMLISKGGLRKYTLVDVACHHFAYKPVSNMLYYSPSITVTIHYRMPRPESERAQFWQSIMHDITSDEMAAKTIYNWHDARLWYTTDSPHRANGYYIILPSASQTAVDDLVAWRQSQGYDVNIITTEYISSISTGDDFCQQIRNYLRDNLSDIAYVLLVGTIVDIPMRSVVPFNNDPDSPYDNPEISPIPTDLYYAELTDHDTLSWNSDRDAYYGEVYNADMEPYGDDNVDYHADVHLGRIPFTTPSNVEDICEKVIRFDSITDRTYKTASLLAGGMIYFESENYSTYPRIDGADNMELLMNDSICDRTNSVYLYEKAGLDTCLYPNTDSLCRNNMKSYWNNKGIMFEYNHGSPQAYWRKIWTWDDGDGIAESAEIEWPLCLNYTDVFDLDNNHPATTYLLSCHCGKPEVDGLGKYLLYCGSSSVICATRIGWVPRHDSSLAHHYYNNLMKDTTASHGIIGDAYDLGRNDHMDATGFWMNTYVMNLYGDPATRQFGTLVGIDVTPPSAPYVYTEKSDDNIVLTWNKVTSDTLGSTETMNRYVVYRGTSPSFVPSQSDSIGATLHPETTYIDSGTLNTEENYYYLTKAVDEAGNKSKKSNMGYKFNKFVNENAVATDKNWVSLPRHSCYAIVSDLTDDVSPSGDPLAKITQLRDDQLFESWSFTTIPFPRWTGTDFAITPGRAYEMVAIKDDTLVLVGANDPHGLVFLNENPGATDKNLVSIPYNAVYTTASQITDEYSPNGGPLTKLTDLRDDQLYESWTYTTVPFPRWTGTDFTIEDGRGYEFVTISDTVWNPTEYSNEAAEASLERPSVNRLGGEMHLGTLTEPDRLALWTVGGAHLTPKDSETQNDYRESGISHLVRGYLELKACEDVIFTAYRPYRHEDVLTENIVGSGFLIDEPYVLFWFDVGNFKKPWQPDEEVIFVIGTSQNGVWYFTYVTFNLDKNVDIQELGNISLDSANQGPQSMSDEDLPLTYSFDVAPSPFVKQTRINYALPKQAVVDIIIYDVSGRQVETLASEMYKPGYYSMVWDGRDGQDRKVSSGIYFIKFAASPVGTTCSGGKAGDYSKTEKLLLVR